MNKMSLRKKYKTAGSHRNIFRFPIFVQKALKKVKTFFFWESTSSSSYFLIFPFSKIFWFLPKNIIIKAEKAFLRNVAIWYVFTYSTANLPPVAILKKFKFFLKKKHLFFQKKTQILNVLRNVTFSTHSTANVLQIWWKREQTRTQLAKSGKKRSLWVEDFPLILWIIWRKIKNRSNIPPLLDTTWFSKNLSHVVLLKFLNYSKLLLWFFTVVDLSLNQMSPLIPAFLILMLYFFGRTFERWNGDMMYSLMKEIREVFWD